MRPRAKLRLFVVVLAFVDVKTRRCHRSTRPSCKTFHTPSKAIRLLIFSNHLPRFMGYCKTSFLHILTYIPPYFRGQSMNTYRHQKYKFANQSIYTLISNLSGRPDIFLGSATLKKWGPKNGVQKPGCKNQGHCYSKREKARLPPLFLNNNDPAFCTLLFAPHILDPVFFQGGKPTPLFITRIKGTD